MFTKYLLVVLLFHGVLSNGSEECVRYYFEDYDDAFTTELPYCDGYYTNETAWSHETYDNSTIPPINDNSNWYIRAVLNPLFLGCTCSFNFTVAPGGLVDVNVYFETVLGDELFVDLMQITEAGVHRIAAWTYVSSATPGWQVIRTGNSTFTGNPPFEGYVRLLGRSSRNSTIIVDSFRYVPLSMDPEEECIFYEDVKIPTDAPTTITPTTTPIAEPATTTDTTPTTTTTTPITTTPKNLTNYIVEERFDFKKSIRISKRKITKVVNFDGVKPPSLGLE